MLRGRSLWLGAVTAILLTAPLAAQNIVLVRQLSFPLMDFGLIADSVSGAQVVAAPGVNSNVGGNHAKFVWLRFSPDSLIPWLDVARTYLETAPNASTPDGIRWAPTLSPVKGSGGLSFGRMVRRGELRDQRYLMVSDSANQWNLEISAYQVGDLLSGLLEVASLSTLSPDSPHRDSDPVDVDVKPSYKSKLSSHTLGLSGRVLFLVVVDSTGVADMSTYATIIASDSLLEADAKRAVAGARFNPGMRAGHPVRVLVCQTITWH